MIEHVGGMQRVSIHLVRELKKNSDVTLHTEILEPTKLGIGIDTFWFLVRELFRLPRVAEDFDADVILFSSMVTASLAFFIRNRVDVPMVTINHGQDVTLPVGVYQWFVPNIFKNLDGVISVSRATRQECIERGMEPGKGVALGNGFDMERLGQFPGKNRSREKLRDKFGIELEGRYMLLTVGRQVRRKGHEWFIRHVFPEVREDAVYVMIGDGPEAERITEAVAESGQKDRIFQLGKISDEMLKYAYAASDLFIMPNIPVEGDMEGFGIVLLEANMAESPAVASDLEGIKDVISQGENGYRVPPLHPEMFAAKVNEVLSGNLQEFSKKAREYVIKTFSWEQVSRKYISYLKEVINGYQAFRS